MQKVECGSKKAESAIKVIKIDNECYILNKEEATEHRFLYEEGEVYQEDGYYWKREPGGIDTKMGPVDSYDLPKKIKNIKDQQKGSKD